MNTLAKTLNPDNIVKLSKDSLGMSGATTVKEAMPKLTIIARENNLDLNTAKGWKTAIELLENKKS